MVNGGVLALEALVNSLALLCYFGGDGAMAYGDGDCAEVGWLLSPHSRCSYPRTFNGREGYREASSGDAW